MDLISLQSLLSAVGGAKAACIGDLMVDQFVYGEVSRVSPHAPIAVLLRQTESVNLGAAGNVARNVCALGAEAVLAGVVGDDAMAHEATRLVDEIEGLHGELVTQVARPTALKTRFVAAGQQLLRVDHEDRSAIDRQTEERLTAAITDSAAGCGVILLSDYGKGCVTDAVIAACHAASKAHGAPLVVDSKATAYDRYGAVDLIKPNAAELAAVTGLPAETDGEVELALRQLLELCQAKAVLVTRGPRGASLMVRGELVWHAPGYARPVFDASGAGDTTFAALGVALAVGASLKEAVSFAMLAAGLSVAKPGTAVATPAELMDAVRQIERGPADAKLATPERMRREIATWRQHGLKVGFTNGCFDILHRGHVAYLAQARDWCDRLVVGLNSDRSVRALKGEGRPINDLESRALVLSGLGSVDLVVAFDEDTPVVLIEAARPDVLVKGADYAKEEVVGHELVESWGGEVKLAPIIEGYSTTAAIEKLSRRA